MNRLRAEDAQELESPVVELADSIIPAPSRKSVALDAWILDDVAARRHAAPDTLTARVGAALPESPDDVAPLAMALAPTRGAQWLSVGTEVAIGPDTQVSIATFLHQIQQRKDAVCLLKTAVGNATGFLLGTDMIMTNNHAFTGKQGILATEANARGAIATFNYERGESGEDAPSQSYELAPEMGFFARTDLDYALCHIRGMPGDRWGWLQLSDAADLAVGDDVYIIQHPRGRPKQLSAAGNEVTYLDPPVIQYTNDTLFGSSGAPVFDFEWRLVALHHAYREQGAEGRTFYRNEGYLSSAILRDLANGPNFARALTQRA